MQAKSFTALPTFTSSKLKGAIMPEITERTFTVTITENRTTTDTEKVWNPVSETVLENGKVDRVMDWVDKPAVVKTERIEWLEQRIETSNPDAVVKAVVQAALKASDAAPTV